MGDRPLAGVAVVVTRPRDRGDELIAGIEAAGGRALHFPAFEIAPLSPEPDQLAPLESFGADDWLIFVSPAAVAEGWPVIQECAPRAAAQAGLAAVGTATANRLASRSGRPVTAPDEGAGAEALLGLPGFTDVTGRNVGLIEGAAGRALLPDTLSSRGARVVRVAVYERRPPSDGRRLESLVREHGVDCLVLTSEGAAENIAAIAGPDVRERLARCQLVASSERVVKRAAELGLGTTFVRAADARDASLLEALAAWRQNVRADKED